MRDENFITVSVVRDSDSSAADVGDFDYGISEHVLGKVVKSEAQKDQLLKHLDFVYGKVREMLRERKVIVNGKEMTVYSERLDYDDVCMLAGFSPFQHPSVGHRHCTVFHIGGYVEMVPAILLDGENVCVEPCAGSALPTFDVAITNNA